MLKNVVVIDHDSCLTIVDACSARRKAAEAEGERGSAMKCNNSFNIASDTSKSVKKREAAAVGTKKASSVASKGRAKASPASSEYDALEYVTPLPDVAADRSTSSLGTNLFAEDRYQRGGGGTRHLPCLCASALCPLLLNHLQVPPIVSALASADL